MCAVMYICINGINSALISMNFLLDFGTVPTVLFLLFLILLPVHWYICGVKDSFRTTYRFLMAVLFPSLGGAPGFMSFSVFPSDWLIPLQLLSP